MDKRTLAVVKAASMDETRLNINTVCFEETGAVVATDGHWLAAHVPASGIPDMPGTQRVVSRDDVGRLAKSLGKGETFKFSAQAFTLDSGARIPAPNAPGANFPDWRRVVPAQIVEDAVRFDVRLLKALCETVIAAGGEEVDVQLGPDDQTPMRMDAALPEQNASLILVLMPMRK